MSQATKIRIREELHASLVAMTSAAFTEEATYEDVRFPVEDDPPKALKHEDERITWTIEHAFGWNEPQREELQCKLHGCLVAETT